MEDVSDPNLEAESKEISKALERIRSSQTFAHSSRLLEFLSFVVAMTARGDSSSLSETTIGVALYHRAPDYDPNLDGIVRIQAKRLRERLLEYYSHEGSVDKLVIRLDSFTPVFLRRGASGATG